MYIFICRCDANCEGFEDEVCGSDGRTYGSECHLEKAACQTNTNITISSQVELKFCEILSFPLFNK